MTFSIAWKPPAPLLSLISLASCFLEKLSGPACEPHRAVAGSGHLCKRRASRASLHCEHHASAELPLCFLPEKSEAKLVFQCDDVNEGLIKESKGRAFRLAFGEHSF